MVVGPTGVGKSTLLNSLMCPAKYTNEYEDCFFKTDNSLASVTKNINQIIGTDDLDERIDNCMKERKEKFETIDKKSL